MNQLYKIASQKEILLSSLKVSFIVGIVLNLINQGEAILSFQLEQINVLNVLLTFIVPFMVASYATSKTKMKLKIGDIAVMDMHIECQHCQSHSIIIDKGRLIPVCTSCQEKSDWYISKNNT